MQNENSTASNSQQQVRLLVIWGALFSSIIIYAGVLFAINVEVQPQSPELMSILPILFIALSVAHAGAALVINKRMYREGVIESLLGIQTQNSGPTTGRVPADVESAKSMVMQKYFTHQVISWVLAESVAIFGLVLGMLSGEPSQGLPYIATAAVLFLALIPKPGKITERLERIKPTGH